MTTITIDLSTTDDPAGRLDAALGIPHGRLDEWIALVTASPRLGAPRHLAKTDQDTFAVDVLGAAGSRPAVGRLATLAARVAAVNHRSRQLTGYQLIALAIAP